MTPPRLGLPPCRLGFTKTERLFLLALALIIAALGAAVIYGA